MASSETDQPDEDKERYALFRSESSKNLANNVGTVEALGGFGLLVLQIAVSGLYWGYGGRILLSFLDGYVWAGVWVGAYFMLTGYLGRKAGADKSNGALNGFLALNILACVLFAGCIIGMTVGAIIIFIGCGNSGGDQFYSRASDKTTPYWWADAETTQTAQPISDPCSSIEVLSSLGLNAVMLLIGVILLILSLIGSVVGCLSVCCRPPTPEELAAKQAAEQALAARREEVRRANAERNRANAERNRALRNNAVRPTGNSYPMTNYGRPMNQPTQSLVTSNITNTSSSLHLTPSHLAQNQVHQGPPPPYGYAQPMQGQMNPGYVGTQPQMPPNMQQFQGYPGAQQPNQGYAGAHHSMQPNMQPNQGYPGAQHQMPANMQPNQGYPGVQQQMPANMQPNQGYPGVQQQMPANMQTNQGFQVAQQQIPPNEKQSSIDAGPTQPGMPSAPDNLGYNAQQSSMPAPAPVLPHTVHSDPSSLHQEV